MRELGLEPPRVGIECGSVLTIRQLLLSGDGLSLLSPDQAAIELQAGLLAALAPPIPVLRMIGIAIRADWRPTATHTAFLETLREAGSMIQHDSQNMIAGGVNRFGPGE